MPKGVNRNGLHKQTQKHLLDLKETEHLIELYIFKEFKNLYKIKVQEINVKVKKEILLFTLKQSLL